MGRLCFPQVFLTRLIKERFRHWCFPDSYLKCLTITFLKREKRHCYKKKLHCYKKRGSDFYRKFNYATFYLTSPRFLYFRPVHSVNRLYIVLSVEKIAESSKYYTCYWAFVVPDLPKLSRRNQPTDTHMLILMTDLIDIYALFRENVSFLECFIRYCNNTTELT